MKNTFLQKRISAWILTSTVTIMQIPNVYAQIYTCKDKNGHMLSADKPIPECADQDMEERNKQGLVKRVIPAPLTDEQKAQKDRELAEQKRTAQEQREKARQDRLLMETYRNEQEILDAKQRNLNDPLNLRKTTQSEVMALEKKLADLRTRAAQYQQHKKPVPSSINSDIARTEQNLTRRQIDLAEQDKIIVKINEKFDGLLKRFGELNSISQNKAPPSKK